MDNGLGFVLSEGPVSGLAGLQGVLVDNGLGVVLSEVPVSGLASVKAEVYKSCRQQYGVNRGKKGGDSGDKVGVDYTIWGFWSGCSIFVSH